MGRIFVLLAVLIVAVLGAWRAVTPLPPTSPPKPPEFWNASAMRDVEEIARAPHPVGSAESERVRSYLASRMKALGAEVSEQPFSLSPESLQRINKWSGRDEKAVTGHNVIGVLPGRDRTRPALLLMAHHDSVWGSPGAGDDAIGIAVILEVARAMRIRGQAERDVILLFTDAEEIGLDGAVAFFDKHPLGRGIGMIVNMEARGAGGRASMFETGPGNGAQMRLYADVVDRPAANSLAVLIYDVMPNSTDYTIAKKRGIPGYNFAVLGRAWTYHSPLSTPQAVDPASIQDMGDQVLALSNALAFTPELPTRTPNVAFADLFSQTMIVYPATGGWVILLIATCLVGTAIWRARTSAQTIRQGMILTIAMTLHGALLLTAVNAVTGSGNGNYYDRLAAIPRLETIAALLIAALLTLLGQIGRPEHRLTAFMVAMTLMWMSLLSGGPLAVTLALALAAMGVSWFLPTSTDDRGEGATALLLFASFALQSLQPTAGPLLHWPLLLAALAMTARAFLSVAMGLTVTAIGAAIGIGHLLTQAHFIFLGVGAEMPALMMVLVFAAWPLLRPLWPDRVPLWIPAIALAAALVLALWVRLDPIAPTVPEYSLTSPGKTKD